MADTIIPLDRDLSRVLSGGRHITLYEEGGVGYTATLICGAAVEQTCSGPHPSIALYGVIKAKLAAIG